MKTDTPEQEEPTAEEAAFKIDSEDAANWYVGKMASIAAERARVEAQAARMLSALDADAARLEFLYGPQLQAYCAAVLSQQKRKKKFVDFWQGRCQFRTQPAALVVTDEVKAIHFAREHAQEALRVEERLNADEYRKIGERALHDGEDLPPGLTRKEERETFSIQFPKK